jgi:lantibiotic biosynthesis protein
MDPRPDEFLDAALRIGRRLAAQAQWEGDACTWVVMAPDRENPAARRAIAATAGGMVYEGTAGIALFLAELAALTGEEELARATLGAVEYALRDAEQLPHSSFGFHSGRTGIAYAAMRAGELLDRPELFARAEAVIRPLEGNESSDMGMDVIAGAGGGIPALLQLARHVDPDLCLGISRRLGDHLIASASRDADGFSWATMRSSSIRNLCGYAHGAAGMGHGLLELYAATGEGSYRYAAEQAFLYERRFFSADESNWPDLRHTRLGEYQFEGRMDDLRQLLRSGDTLPRQEPRYMAAWCHGAPGIGFTRLRAWELLGEARYLEEARASFRSVERSVSDELMMNYSLCHGRGGNCETLIEGARILGEPALLEPAQAVARAGIERHEREDGTPWPCGTMGSVSDPGLLLGETGIGMFLLRLARPEVPSALFVTAPDASAAEGSRAGAEGYEALRSRTVQEHFEPTLRSFAALGVEVDAVLPPRPMGAAPERTDVRAAYEALAAHVAAEPDVARRGLLEDAFMVDRARFELATSVEDYTREILDSLGRLSPEEVEWTAGRAGLSERVRVVSTRHDWGAWLQAEDAPSPPQEADVHYLLHFAAGRVAMRRLSPFAALVLQTVEEPATVEEILGAVQEALGGEGAADRGWLEDRVVEQLAQAYRAGFISFAGGMVPAAA